MTRYCYKHKLAGCVDVKNRKCMFPEGCKRRATYGSMLPLHADPSRSIKASQNLPDAPSTPEKSEGTHAPPRAAAAPRTDAASASNTSADARPRSSSASSSSDAAAAPVMRGRKSVAHFCALHRSPTDFRLFRKSCSSERGCSKIATFGLEQEGIARFCSKHKPPSYVDVRNPKCQAMVVGEAGGQPCGRRACFGDKRNPRATACSQHRQLMHVNLVKGRDD